jgi:hypothetical protein
MFSHSNVVTMHSQVHVEQGGQEVVLEGHNMCVMCVDWVQCVLGNKAKNTLDPATVSPLFE